MKRRILSLVLLLVMLLSLSACKKTTLQIPNSKKDAQKLSSVENCHLLLCIRINPQFEIYLDEDGTVLKIIGGNADGKKLLANMDLTGLLYDDAVNAILDAAAAQGLLKDGAHVRIDVLASADGALTYEQSRQLEQVVTRYDDKLTTFVDQSAVIAAEYGADLIEVEHWENGDVWYSYFCEWTLLRETLYAADGSYSDYVYDGKNTLSSIFITPDGRRTEEHFTYDEAGLVLTWQHVWQEGDDISIEEERFTYDEAGLVLTRQLVLQEGDFTSTMDEWFEDGVLTHSLEMTDECSSEHYYDENGNITRSLEVKDGATQERHFDTNGMCTYAYDSFPNGDWRKDIYYPNGMKKSEEGISNGVYYSFFYDEKGQQIQ